MSRLEVPIADQKLWNTGDVRLWADLQVLLKDSAGKLVPEELRVDTATDVTTFPAYDAKQQGLPISRKANPDATHTQTGLSIRSGVLRFRIVGMDATEHAIACLFLGDQDTPPDPRQAATLPRKLLQPFQLLDQLRFTLQKDPALGNLYGELVVEKV
jgi:hypothetical protein